MERVTRLSVSERTGQGALFGIFGHLAVNRFELGQGFFGC